MANTVLKKTFFTEEDEKFLRDTKIPLRLSCLTGTGWPLIVSLWYLYTEGKLLCSTQKSSKLIQFLENDSRCAFEIAPETPPYRGIRGKGTVSLEEESARGILEKLILRYLGGKDSSLAQYLLSRDNEVAIVITPEKLYTWDYSERMQDSVAK